MSVTTEIQPIGKGPFGDGGVVQGYVSDGWEPVRRAFEENFALNMELGAQLVIYHGENVVVDLHGKSSKQKVYSADTIQNIYSSGKNMEAIVMALLVDRGVISYDDLVVKHWPEFGDGNKSDITIADVLRHEAGVPFFSDPDDMANPWKDTQLTCNCLESIAPMERAIERAGKWHLLGRRHYHAVTRGWLLSGIVRRVDSKGRTLAQFMRDEICIPLQLDIYCGIHPSEQSLLEIANIKNMPFLGAGTIIKAVAGGVSNHVSKRLGLKRTTTPAMNRNHISNNVSHSTSQSEEKSGDEDIKGIDDVISASEVRGVSTCNPSSTTSPGAWGVNTKFPATGDPRTVRAIVKTFTSRKSPILRHNVAEWLLKDCRWVNSVAGRAQEVPSANMHANARSIAKINTLFINEGRVGDTQLMSRETVVQAFSDPIVERDEFINAVCSFTQGGFSRMSDMESSMVPADFKTVYDGFWGWGGLGGSWSLWDPHRRISFAYVMNARTLQTIGGPRGDRIMRAVQAVLDEKGIK
eukprot:CAMPEP_0185020148 /NCGR_PEP_ID=MMETSP1103-20130426/2743_1 /TAXON_ID=36769 /ORGANISM="Paraphysomonas bandaiensis, Strain Caron Lab Isolate" /LENGTH=522 /DNA_ID=CAMNT_0027550871 /DNA_START=241 /DNA_END=1809 /DNA_ORIENTATION=-